MRQTRRQNYRALTDTKMFRALRRRYHRLVNKEFSEGLTEREAAKQERLGRQLDRYADCVYDPVIAGLEAVRMAQNGATLDGEGQDGAE